MLVGGHILSLPWQSFVKANELLCAVLLVVLAVVAAQVAVNTKALDRIVQRFAAEYLDGEQSRRIDEIAADVYAALAQIESLSQESAVANDPFDFQLDLKRDPLIDL